MKQSERYEIPDDWKKPGSTIRWTVREDPYQAPAGRYYNEDAREIAPGDVGHGPYLVLLQEAMAAWQKVVPVTFVETGTGTRSELIIVGRTDYGSTGEREGSGMFTWVFEGDEPHEIHVDLNAGFSQTKWYNIALQDVGHAMGLDFSGDGGSAMHIEAVENGTRNELTAQDIEAARALYGTSPGAHGGDDTLNGGPGSDTLRGGDGDDALLGGSGDDTVTGGSGNDRLWGQDGNDRVEGGGGHDLIFGEDGADFLSGGPGEDVILAGADRDTIDGGSGFDRIWAGDGDDTVEGGSGRNFIGGGAGNDRINGGGDTDVVIAGAGNDTVNGGGGADRIIGGLGDDRIIGGDGLNYLNGSDGDDSITGGADRDYLDGEGGNDTLNGGASRGLLVGGAGNDSLVGGGEGDTFFGGPGADVFHIAGGRNWIMDFDSADRITIGMTLAQVQGAATQLGPDLHVELAGGGDLYLAGVALSDIEADNLV